MRKVLFLVVILFSVNQTNAQSPLDTLKISLAKIAKQPPSDKRDSTIMNTLRYLIYEEKNKSQKQIFKDSLKKLSENSKWIKAKAYNYLLLGNLSTLDNQLYTAFDYFEKSLIEYKKLGDVESMLKVNNRFIPMMNWNMIENEISDDVKIKYLRYMQEASALAKAQKDTAVWSNVDITMAAYYTFVLKDYKKGYFHANFTQKLIENQNRSDWLDSYYICDLGKTICLLNTNQEKKGLEMIDKTIQICQKENKKGEARYVLSQIGTFVGKYFLEKKDYKTALKYALIGEKNNTFLNFPYFENVLNKVLYQTYKGLNQPAKAFGYLEKVNNYEEIAETQKLNENYAEWQLKYDDEKQKTQIKTLENENLKRANERKDSARNILIISSLIGVFITIYVFQNNKKLKTKNEELKQKNNEILGAMSKGQNIERKRVASELHDNLNTKLVALKWRFEALDTSKYPVNDQKILSDFIRVLDDIYLDVRLISHNLLPAELETLGLVVALQKLLENISNQHIKFHFLNEGIEQRFNPIFEHELYNIALELINNILKHAQATQAWISLTMQNDKISLTVADNGKGIDLSKLSDGVGLRNVHSRVENLNGKLQISKGNNDTGTSVQVDLSI